MQLKISLQSFVQFNLGCAAPAPSAALLAAVTTGDSCYSSDLVIRLANGCARHPVGQGHSEKLLEAFHLAASACKRQCIIPADSLHPRPTNPSQHLTPCILQVIIHGVADNWSNLTDDTLVEKAVRSHSTLACVEHTSECTGVPQCCQQLPVGSRLQACKLQLHPGKTGLIVHKPHCVRLLLLFCPGRCSGYG